MHKKFTFWDHRSSNLVTSFFLLLLFLFLFLWSTLCIGSFWAVHSLPEGNCGMFVVSFCCFLALLYHCTDFKFINRVLVLAHVLLHHFVAMSCMHFFDCILHECMSECVTRVFITLRFWDLEKCERRQKYLNQLSRQSALKKRRFNIEKEKIHEAVFHKADIIRI